MGMAKERTCGTCAACCRFFPIPEIDKPPRVPCHNLESCGYGCKIYQKRPQQCADYQCEWLRGVGHEEDQPDKTGVLIDRRMTGFGTALVAKLLDPDSELSEAGQAAINRAVKHEDMICLIVSSKNSDLVMGAAGPAILLEIFKREHDEREPVLLGGPKEYVEVLVDRIKNHKWPSIRSKHKSLDDLKEPSSGYTDARRDVT